MRYLPPVQASRLAGEQTIDLRFWHLPYLISILWEILSILCEFLQKIFASGSVLKHGRRLERNCLWEPRILVFYLWFVQVL